MLLPLWLNLYDTGVPVRGADLSASNTAASLYAPGSIEAKDYCMDGIPRITVTQGQWPGLYCLMRTATGALVNQASVESVTAYVFRPSVDGGDPVSVEYVVVEDAVYDTVQYSDARPAGFNVKHTFEMDLPPEASGGSAYVLELAVELQTGEVITQKGRVLVEPTLHRPSNAY